MNLCFISCNDVMAIRAQQIDSCSCLALSGKYKIHWELSIYVLVRTDKGVIRAINMVGGVVAM